MLSRLCTFFSLATLLFAVGCSPFTEASAPAEGEKVLRLQSGRIRDLDPALSGNVSSAKCCGRIFESLFQVDYHARPYKLNPLLAASLPEVSEDGLTYWITLRDDLYFADDPCFPEGRGRKLTMEDIRYSLLRVADNKVESGGFWIFRDRIVGLDEFREVTKTSDVTNYEAEVEGLKILSDGRLQIILKKPYPQLGWVLAMGYAAIVPRDAIEYYESKGERFSEHPVGSGPYKLMSWHRNHRLEFIRNDNWRARCENAANDGIPSVNRIVVNIIDDANTAFLCFLNGELDMYENVSRDNEDAVFSGKELSEDLLEQGIRLEKHDGINLYYIGFNMDDPVVGRNKKLRQAMTCAFNTKEWLQFYNGRVTRAHCPVPPGVAGFVPDKPFPFDLERAKQLMVEAGYPEGIDPKTGSRLELSIDLGSPTAEMRESIELLTKFVDEIGIKLKPNYNTSSAFFEKIERREAQIFRLGWFADYPDAENFLMLFFGPNGSPGPNHVNYNEAAYNELFNQVRVMQDSPERTALYEQLARVVMDDCCMIFTHYPMNYVLRHDWLKGYTPTDFPYGMEKFFDLERAAP